MLPCNGVIWFIKALGRSRGGFGTKVCVASDGHGKALSFTLSPGQADELPAAYALFNVLPRSPSYVVCDRGYVFYKFYNDIWERGAHPVILPGRNDSEVGCSKRAYRPRLVKNLWLRLKGWRAVTTRSRYGNTVAPFLSVSLIAATTDYIKL